MITYTCKNGDRLDQICAIHYGKAAGAVEVVLAANPGLADIDTYFAGLKIALPTLDAPQKAKKETVRLWG